MNRVIRTAALVLLSLLLAAPALAQPRVIIDDPTGRVNQQEVERAAQDLVSRGATVVVLVSEQTGSDPQAYAQRRLAQYGVAADPLEPGAIIYLVALDQRKAFIYYGADWNAALGPTYKNILDSEMLPQFARGNITDGLTAGMRGTLDAIENPPGSGPNINIGAGTFTPIIVGVITLVLFLVGGPAAVRSFNKRRQAARALEKARQAAEEARRKAGAVIADLGQAFSDARAKAEYDRLSYPAGEVAQLAQLQGEAEAQFVKAQEQFDHAGEVLRAKRTPIQADYQQVAAAYNQAAELAAAAREKLDQVQARRIELDKLNAEAPQAIDRAKKALADTAGRLQALSGDFTSPDAVMRSARAEIARADSLLGEHRAADVIAVAQAVSAALDELNQILARYADLREGIAAGRASAAQAAEQGYRVEAGLKALDAAEATLLRAARALEQEGPAAAQPLLDQAEAALAEGIARGGGMPELRRKNEQRIPAVEQAGQQLDAYIAEGRRTFDIVDEFAESTWSDIRGNGSEAEAAAARSRALWERAGQRNSMEVQDFLGAQQDLDAAEQQIASARSLVDTIIQRLKDLEAARDAARQEIAAAQADVERGWAFVRSRDADIGKDPEAQLNRAAALLEQVQAEINQPRPDWLAIVRQAREANQLADAALATARSEVEKMDKLRDQVERAQQLATAEVKKIVQFASHHANDLPPGSDAALARLQSDVQAAYATLREVEQVEEEARASALRTALTRYTALEDTAEKLYAQLYDAFQRIDKLRRRVDAEVERAEQAIERAERIFRAYEAHLRGSTEGIRSLDAARQALATIGRVNNEQEMERALRAAAEARTAADRAYQIFSERVAALQQARHRDDDLGDFLAGALIGSMLSGGRGGHGSHRSGGGGGGWSSGGGSFGGWGGGGGSWGGGGGGGSWGGGGGGSGW